MIRRRTKKSGLLRASLVMACAALLSGCFQAQLNGPVAGATVTVSDLNDPNTVYASATSWDPDYIIGLNNGSSWNRTTSVTRLWLLGIFQLDVNSLDDNTYYLVTASGGEDTDADRNNLMDDSYTPVVGEWRAIMSGAQLKSVGPKVTPLTEAIYLWLAPQLDSLNADQIAVNLDRAGAQMVTADLNEDGSADYADLLSWSPQFHRGFLQVALNTVNELADLVTVGGADNDRTTLAQQVLPIEITEETDITAESYFADHVAGPVLDAACQSCHVAGGPSESTRLVFEQRGADNEDALNEAILADFLTSIDGGAELLLSKVQGVAHGGGTWFTSNSSEYASLNTYIGLVTGDSGGGGGNTGEGFWAGLVFMDARETLRRAALIFAGREPTNAEYSMADSGDDGLREAIRGLLKGSGFHDFLLTGANDRLHTDAFLNGLFPEVGDINAAPHYPVGTDKYYYDTPTTDEEWDAKWRWERAWQVGIARAPVELIAFVVEREKPYTEILTADYTMVNWQSSEFLRSNADFGGAEDDSVFKPGRNRGQVFIDEQHVSEYTEGRGLRIDSHSGFMENYPHAGVLNTQAFLNRYPTTETNRNRARSRWTYLHFLDVDIEKSASRTTDPEALADTNNPTMNNPACTVCHIVMDPIGGTYQNYSNEGFYRSSWGGQDSLPDTYKYPEWFDENAEPSPYQEGDTWFRDMRAPGLPDQGNAPNPDNSLQWLAQRIAEDPRFARASVKFWWPAAMGANVLLAPESASDNGYQQRLAAFEQQTTDIQALADGFSEGYNGGSAYDLKDLLVEMAMSGWFRAKAVEPGAASGRDIELDSVGTRRLLSPMELDAKTRALLGEAWGEEQVDWDWDGEYTELSNRFNIYYGGIDSFGIKERARQLTALMSNVANRMALTSACTHTALDFGLADNQRRLFAGITETTTPLTEGVSEHSLPSGEQNRSVQQFSLNLATGDKRVRVSFLNPYWDNEAQMGSQVYIDSVRVTRNGQAVLDVDGGSFRDYPGFEQRVDFWEGEYYDSGGEHWGNNGPEAWQFWTTPAWITLPLEITEAGDYQVEVTAWGFEVPDGNPVRIGISVEASDPYGNHAGAESLRQVIANMHEYLLGQSVSTDSEEVAIAYELLVDTWQERVTNNDSPWMNEWPEENCPQGPSIWELPEEEQTRLWGDPALMKGSWSIVLTYMLSHFNFLHE